MIAQGAAACVERLWSFFQARNWEGARALLHEGFVCEWPQTGEVFRGRDNYIEMNRAHPAPNWRIELLRMTTEKDRVVAEVRVPSDGALDFCVGVYDLRDGRIARATEYWVEHAPAAPEWRAPFREQPLDARASPREAPAMLPAADIVEAQLRAFNGRDVEAYAACYSDDVVVEDAAGNVTLQGIGALRGEFRQLFEQAPELRCEVSQRIAVGEYVIAEERVFGGPEPVHAAVVYHVRGDRIVRMRVIR